MELQRTSPVSLNERSDAADHSTAGAGLPGCFKESAGAELMPHQGGSIGDSKSCGDGECTYEESQIDQGSQSNSTGPRPMFWNRWDGRKRVALRSRGAGSGSEIRLSACNRMALEGLFRQGSIAILRIHHPRHGLG